MNKNCCHAGENLNRCGNCDNLICQACDNYKICVKCDRVFCPYHHYFVHAVAEIDSNGEEICIDCLISIRYKIDDIISEFLLLNK